ncbi:DNA mismatch repair protein MutS2 [Lachnospiraceae bacterium PM6-15]|uniref:Endonuclease MutS2 n=1 Tax=Ohessyouella blattaphilus TaxID=2949333 RepID=A0ABT1EGZ5_9FIRM|nr:endonuclease MutS2 [Ohessyouella blattaphilus]MCP1109979.1 endonuclease MutS2 [Ohessyouella blattaphilus]MCR8563373.1 endonuclease MutS2 [Ohessyouella blattaphilus]MDL2250966.1 endonuclease MutS2 [Lachnospiraceae bacterium OttesenSCG-928-J05]
MNTEIQNSVEFTAIKERILTLTTSDLGKERLALKEPSTNLQTVNKRLTETSEAVTLLNAGKQAPFMGVGKIKYLTKRVVQGSVLEVEELIEYADFLRSFRQIKSFFTKFAFEAPTLLSYALGLQEFTEIEEEIYESIQGHQVNSSCSKALSKVRKSIGELEASINKALQKCLRNNADIIQDSIISVKNGHYTIPIKSEFKNQFAGTVIETSAKGITTFMEPGSVSKMNTELQLKKGEEDLLVYQILANLTGLISQYMEEIKASMEILAEIDLIFARARYSSAIGGKRPEINKCEYVYLDQVTHPLLGKDAVPLTLKLGKNFRLLAITGANAGGKTVTLKTLGLLTLMTMFGLLIPCEKKTNMCLFDDILIDIGDNQSMENSLSTFSAHMSNLSHILNKAGRNTLVLLDELGSGTDPKEGAALGIAILEHLYQKGALILATTHYGELKEYARKHQDSETAAMDFDHATLLPKYQLLLGETGESGALTVAKRMGIRPDVLKSAKNLLANATYETAKAEFAEIAEKESLFPAERVLQKGDRVKVSEEKDFGLFYEMVDSHTASIYLNHQFIQVPQKKVTLVEQREQLYPADYDFESLFEDFSKRKLRRDLERGSKKALKQLDKDAKKRKNTAK